MDYETKTKTRSCGTYSEIYIARVHKVNQMVYGLRWFLDVLGKNGSRSRLKKYSNFRCSNRGWNQFRKEMKRIGLEFPNEADKEITGETVALVCRDSWYIIKVHTDNNGTSVIFLREATFREQRASQC